MSEKPLILFRVIPSPRDPDRALLRLICKTSTMGYCDFPLWTRPALDSNGTKRWQWDGNVEAPSVTPSIDCLAGCGRHFVMTKGQT